MSDDSAPVSEVIKSIYSGLDRIAEEAAVKTGATCRKGCAECCKLLALCTFAEGIYLAEEVAKRPDWKELVDKMRVHALEMCYDGISEASYMDKQFRCSFLADDNTCKVYAARPSCCRYHLVLTDPKLCSIEHKNDIRKVLDLRYLEAEVWRFSEFVTRTSNIPGIATAPIPVMVLHILRLITDGPEREYVKKATEGIPDPIRWLELYAKGLTGGKEAVREPL